MSQADNFSLYEKLLGTQTCKLTVRLNLLKMDEDSSPPLEDFAEANYPGYSPKEFQYADSPQLNPAQLFAQAESIRLDWILEEDLDSPLEIKGFYVTADFPDNSSALVQWENFVDPPRLTKPGNAFSTIIVLTAKKVPQEG